MPRNQRALRCSLTALCGAAALHAGSAAADEGQWPIDTLSTLDLKQFQGLGLRLSAEQIWSDDGGIARASVNVSGCSGAFVSKDGLIATNHHCAYRAIQSQSSPERDLLKGGFLARKRGDELEAKGLTVRVLQTITDVTGEIEAVKKAAPDDAARSRAIDRRAKELVATCEAKGPGLRCDVADFFLGKQYKLFQSLELRDVRLVYAPRAAIGEYGGEVDNWMWPRHTGDFALLRAYAKAGNQPAEHAADNVPFTPQVHLSVSADGVRAGELVMVMGYPGQTHRHLPRPEVERHVEQVLPGVISLYGAMLDILRDEAKKSPGTAIKVAALEKSLANRHKNSRGMLEGIRSMNLLDRRTKEQAALDERAKAPERAAERAALAELSRLSEERRESHDRELLLSAIARGPNLLALAVDLARLATERAKPDLERSLGYQQRDLAALRQSMARRLRDFDAEVDARLLALLVSRARALPATQKIAALDRIAPGQSDPTGISRALAPRFRASTLPKEAERLFDADAATLAKNSDPIVTLGRELAAELERVEQLGHARSGRLSRSGPLYFGLLEAVRSGPVYPDANGTLRVSFARLMGYSPRDGLTAVPHTTLRGAIAKHTGADPFDLPAAVIEKAPAARDSYWADPELGDLPLCFLTNADTTGGNSGSPIVDGQGRLVGLNFDRVWENIAGDFGYTQSRSRNIGVDIRYMLWLLDRVEDASELLLELDVAQYRDKSVRRGRADAPARAPRPQPSVEPTEEPKRGCSLAPGGGPTAGVVGLLYLLALAGARRRRSRSLQTS
ncbi:MAG: S46 family peptidase [Polyangiaceae bacterium]|nr:S46 family peptidase [Polyangiaceae bacterium]